jgi:3',5'-cyclic AMP phosphodiesterase CpdA
MKRLFLLGMIVVLSSCVNVYLGDENEAAEMKLTQPVSDGSLKFVIVADLHHDVVPDAVSRLVEVQKAAGNVGADFLIQLGDFSERSEDENSLLMNQWNSYVGNKIHVLGNHDMDHCSKKEEMDYWNLDYNYFYSDVKGVRLIVLDPNFFIEKGNYVHYEKGNYYAHPDTRGTIPEQQIEWLDKVVGEAPGKVLIFSHQSLEQPGSIKNAEEVRAVLEKHNSNGVKKVVACFNGHEHIDKAVEINGIHYVQINSASYQWLGEKFKNKERYTKELYEQYPILENVIGYEKTLYAVVTLEDSRLVIDGVQGDFIGTEPDMKLYSEVFKDLPLSASIEDRILNF